MIIEIKDLPEGRKVQRILVDIVFEDSGTPEESQTLNVSNPGNTIKKENKDRTEPLVHTEPVLETTKDTDFENRPERAIPQEMLNIEF